MFHHFVQSKLKSFSTLLTLGICLALSQVSNLEAGGWGKNQEVVICEGTTFNGVYFDMNGLDFVAAIPNYSGAILQNGEVRFNTTFEDDSGYLISTTLNAGFTPPHHERDFVKMVQDANPDYIVHALNSRDYGAVYCVDMIPKDQNDSIFWRLLCTKNHLIKMATSDKNENRRFHFFESIYINKH